MKTRIRAFVAVLGIAALATVLVAGACIAWKAPSAGEWRGQAASAAPPGTIRVATFNIRMFPCNTNCECKQSFGFEHCLDKGQPRTNLEMLAGVIREMKADLIAVNEILDPDAFSAFATEKLGPDWQFIYAAEGGSQKVGFLYNSSVVTAGTKQVFKEIYTGLVRKDHPPQCLGMRSALRPAFACHFLVNGTKFDFQAVVLHLKSGPCPSVRKAQWKLMEKVVDRLAQKDPDVIVLGDFNDIGTESKDFTEFRRNKKYSVATETVSCTHYGRGSGATLDYILVSSSAHKHVVKGSALVGGPCATGCGKNPHWKRYRNAVSDHCPVSVQLRPMAD
ncbi:MAG: endonuclease/exonuclease/phosphatase family protein [Desulfomonile sp.]|nr:endonuclease/exonuclease/phosphatase family protein [Desulfomonile sp.]